MAQLGLLPQGQPERQTRVRKMVAAMDAEGSGNCSKHGECEAVCPKGIKIDVIAGMNRDYLETRRGRTRVDCGCGHRRRHMDTRVLGSVGPRVSALGLGCMGMSDLYGPADRAESLVTIHAALDAGLTLLDTGDFYGMGHNEMLLREALRSRSRDGVVLSVKFGALRDVGGNWAGVDGRPAAVKNFLAYTLQRLDTDHVDIYRLTRADPAVPVEDTVGAIAEMVKAGHVRHVGLSEAGPATIRRAHAVHPVCDLQIEYSLFSRGIEEVQLGPGVRPRTPTDCAANCRPMGPSRANRPRLPAKLGRARPTHTGLSSSAPDTAPGTWAGLPAGLSVRRTPSTDV